MRNIIKFCSITQSNSAHIHTQLDYVITQLNCVANVIELRWEHNQIAFVTQSNCVTYLENNFVQKKNWEIQTGVDSVKDFFYEDSSTKIRKMLQQRNFISKAYGSIDGETGKDISAYFRLELNEQNFVAHPCFGILFKRLKICCGRNFFMFCNSMLTPTNTIF